MLLKNNVQKFAVRKTAQITLYTMNMGHVDLTFALFIKNYVHFREYLDVYETICIFY